MHVSAAQIHHAVALTTAQTQTQIQTHKQNNRIQVSAPQFHHIVVFTNTETHKRIANLYNFLLIIVQYLT